ncbi:MAG: hypothetical protein OQK24_09475 [Magnetovibrio sp.]|nr:hypothetical protein [Magnetovibrio sp.]
MKSSKPVILKDCSPLANKDDLLDEGLQKAFDIWQAQYNKGGKVPLWNMDFAMDNSTIVSRTIMYDTSRGEILMTIIGEECRNFIGLEKSKGLLKDLMPKPNIDDVTTRLNKCAELRKPTYCYKTMSWNHDRDYMKYEVLFLPFVTSEGDECTWFFVPMSFQINEGANML